MTPNPRWTMDESGYVYWQAGTKMFRMAGPGVLCLWDKGSKTERQLTTVDIVALTRQFMALQGDPYMQGEPDEQD